MDSQHTNSSYWLSSPSYMGVVQGAPQTITVVILEDYWSQILKDNISIIKTFEILWTLPKCDTETQSDENAVEKNDLIESLDVVSKPTI